MHKILFVGNIVFLPINDFNDNLSPKYLQSSVGGEIYGFRIWNKEEILTKYPDAKECKNLIEFGKEWSK